MKTLLRSLLLIGLTVAGLDARAAPIKFDEATGGDLDVNPCRPLGLCPFQLGFGANRFVGSSFFDLSDPVTDNWTYDFDVVTFRSVTPVRLRISYEILDLEQSSDFTPPWTMGFWMGPVIAGGNYPPAPYCGTAILGQYPMFDTGTGALLRARLADCILDSPAAWDWRLAHFSLAGNGDQLRFSYRFTLLVTPVPEPGTFAMLLCGLIALGLASRSRKGAVMTTAVTATAP
jgi:hypothetical protein